MGAVDLCAVAQESSGLIQAAFTPDDIDGLIAAKTVHSICDRFTPGPAADNGLRPRAPRAAWLPLRVRIGPRLTHRSGLPVSTTTSFLPTRGRHV